MTDQDGENLPTLENDLIIQEEVEHVINTPTPYEDKSCGIFHCAYFPIAKFCICGHWIVHVFIPLIITLAFIFTTAMGYYAIFAFESSTLAKVGFGIGFTAAALSVVLVYVNTIVIGPGYLPFNYAATRKKDLTWDESMKTIAVYREQVEYARASDRPPRASFTLTARRFVLRADHFCSWTKTWVGLNNHRFYLLLPIWIFIYAAVWYSCHIYYDFSSFRWPMIFSGIAAIMVLGALIYSQIQLFLGTRNLCVNATSLERWKGTMDSKWDQGCLNNFSEVCGEKKYMLLWIFPCFCFKPPVDGFYGFNGSKENIEEPLNTLSV